MCTFRRIDEKVEVVVQLEDAVVDQLQGVRHQADQALLQHTLELGRPALTAVVRADIDRYVMGELDVDITKSSVIFQSI